jgi:hypothetical protein
MRFEHCKLTLGSAPLLRNLPMLTAGRQHKESPCIRQCKTISCLTPVIKNDRGEETPRVNTKVEWPVWRS